MQYWNTKKNQTGGSALLFQSTIDASIADNYPPPVQNGYWNIINKGFLSSPNPDVELYISADSIDSFTIPIIGNLLDDIPSKMEPSFVFGKFNNAAYFTEFKRYRYPFFMSGKKSIRFWTKFDSSSDTQPGQYIFELASENNFAARFSWHTVNGFVFSGFGAYVSGSYNFEIDEWIHCEIKLDFDDNAAYLYINGTLATNGGPNFFSTPTDPITKIVLGLANSYIDNFIVVNNHNPFDPTSEITPVQYTQFFEDKDLLFYDANNKLNGGWIGIRGCFMQGISSDFTSVDGKTITVTNGIVTSII